MSRYLVPLVLSLLALTGSVLAQDQLSQLRAELDALKAQRGEVLRTGVELEVKQAYVQELLDLRQRILDLDASEVGEAPEVVVPAPRKKLDPREMYALPTRVAEALEASFPAMGIYPGRKKPPFWWGNNGRVLFPDFRLSPSKQRYFRRAVPILVAQGKKPDRRFVPNGKTHSYSRSYPLVQIQLGWDEMPDVRISGQAEQEASFTRRYIKMDERYGHTLGREKLKGKYRQELKETQVGGYPARFWIKTFSGQYARPVSRLNDKILHEAASASQPIRAYAHYDMQLDLDGIQPSRLQVHIRTDSDLGVGKAADEALLRRLLEVVAKTVHAEIGS